MILDGLQPPRYPRSSLMRRRWIRPEMLLGALAMLGSGCEPLADDTYEGEPLLVVNGYFVDDAGEYASGGDLQPVIWWIPPPDSTGEFVFVDSGYSNGSDFNLWLSILFEPWLEVIAPLATPFGADASAPLAFGQIVGVPRSSWGPARREFYPREEWPARIAAVVEGYVVVSVGERPGSPTVDASVRLFGISMAPGIYLASVTPRDADELAQAEACEAAATSLEAWVACPSRWPAITPLRSGSVEARKLGRLEGVPAFSWPQ